VAGEDTDQGATRGRGNGRRAPRGAAGSRFPLELKHAAATLYYIEERTQAEIAERLGASVATVSRLLSEARRDGMVRVQVLPPGEGDGDGDDLATRLAETLELDAVHLSSLPAGRSVGAALAPALSRALLAAELTPGEALLVSSGRTVYEAAQAELPSLPGIAVAPMVGGLDEPEVWFATNEITRQVAAKVGGTPRFLYAPALPGPGLHESVLHDPSTRRVVGLWDTARVAIMGVGAPPLTRTSLHRFIADDTDPVGAAVGDVCARFYDAAGQPVPFPGSERLIATSLENLQRMQTCIAIAAGTIKVPSLLAGARSGYFSRLVTDRVTARALLDAAASARRR